MEQFKETCAKHNLKITPQRTLIYQELLKAKDHPSAEMIYGRVRVIFPTISFNTVYTTLLKYRDIGLINIVEGYGESKRFDPITNKHHHFRCIKCNNIIDIYNDYYDSIKIPIEIKDQFVVLNQKILIEGICEKCQIKD